MSGRREKPGKKPPARKTRPAKRAPAVLTPKQQLFVQEYLVDCNATAAAKRAGYSERSASRIGADLLQKSQVADAIHAAMEKRSQAVGITAERVLEELSRIAFLDPREIFQFGPDGVRLKDSAQLTPGVAACVAEVSQTVSAEGGSIRAKTHDKLKALELCARHLGMLNDKLEVSASWDVMYDRLREGRERVRRG